MPTSRAAVISVFVCALVEELGGIFFSPSFFLSLSFLLRPFPICHLGGRQWVGGHSG